MCCLRMPLVLLVIQLVRLCSAEPCKPNEECSVKSWREWENCRGNCENLTMQVRKRTICIDYYKVQPFTRENVIQFCNITAPTLETRPCLSCPVGIYNAISQKCEKCNYVNCSDDPCKQGTCNDTANGIRCVCNPGYAGFDCGTMIPNKMPTEYLLPLWLPPLEYGILTLTTLIIIMTAGCLCLKCCQVCGCCSSDDDDDEDEERKRKKKKDLPYRSHGSRKTQKPSALIDF